MSAFGRAFARLGLFVQRHGQRQCLASSPGAAPRRATSRSSGHSSKPRAEQQQQRSDGSSSSSDERQSHGPPTGRGASCTNMNIHMAQGDGRDLPSSLTGASARSRGARSKGGDTRARSSGSDRRASVPRPAKGCGDSCTDMSVNVTHLISRRARRARRRRDKERRERALSPGALDESTSSDSSAQGSSSSSSGGRQSRDPSRDAVFHVLMNIIERTEVIHSSSGLCEYPPVPRPVKGRGYSCTNVNVKRTSLKRPLIEYQLWVDLPK